MTRQRSPIGALLSASILGAMALAGCVVERSSAAEGDGPPPTIGLGSDLGNAATIPSDLVADGADDIDSIVMTGDSITVASTPALEDRFGQLGFDDVVIEAMTGKRLAVSFGDNPSGADVARFVANADGGDAVGQLWVIALGTNDINQYGAPEEIAAAVDEVLAEVPSDVPLVWVDTYYRDQSDGADLVNVVVADRLSRRGDAVMAPWNAFAAGDDVLRSDGVHPSTSGTAVFADVVRATVDGFLGR